MSAISKIRLYEYFAQQRKRHYAFFALSQREREELVAEYFRRTPLEKATTPLQVIREKQLERERNAQEPKPPSDSYILFATKNAGQLPRC